MTTEFSPLEVFGAFVQTILGAEVPAGGVVVGPATKEQQAAGVVCVMPTGTWRNDTSSLVVWQRLNVRCIAPSFADAESIGQHVYLSFNTEGRHRHILAQASNGHTYLVHAANPSVGTPFYNSDDSVWEFLVVVEALFGLGPVT